MPISNSPEPKRMICRRAACVVAASLTAMVTLAAPVLAQTTTTRPAAGNDPLAAWSTAHYAYEPAVVLAVPRPPTQASALLPYAVACGNWATVAEQLQALAPQDALRVHQQILKSLSQTKPAAPGPQMSPADVFALADTLPGDVDLPDAALPLLGQLLAGSVASGGLPAEVLATLDRGTAHLGGADPAKRVRLATVFYFAGKSSLAAPYLPSPADAAKSPDAPLTPLVYRNTLAAASEADAAGDATAAAGLRKAALAIAMARLQSAPASENTAALVNDVFSLCEAAGDQQRLIDWVGGLCKSGLPQLDTALLRLAKSPPPAPGNQDARVNALTLQRQVADLLIKDGPAKLKPGSPRQAALELFAANWTAEAALTRASILPPHTAERKIIPNRPFGWSGAAPGEADIIPAQRLLLLRPSDAWIDALRPDTRLALWQGLIPLAMYADETDLALAALSSVAKVLPDSQDQIAGDALLFWAKKHEARRIIGTNAANQPVAIGVPLTRRAQDRSIGQLASMLAAMEKMYGRRLAPAQVLSLFTTIYSQAEVFQLSDIERVFGPLERLDADTTLSFAALMQTNLETVWQDVKVYNAFGTGLDANEIAARVTNGYTTLISVLGRQSDATHDYRVDVALANAELSQSKYLLLRKAGLSVYTAARNAAFESIHRAAERYAAGVSAAKHGDESGGLYSLWFAMALGSADITKPGASDVTDTAELARLATALRTLPGDAARRHTEQFTFGLVSRLKDLPAESKQTVLRAAMPIVGDSAIAWPITTLVHSYDDLLSEVGLNLYVDGPTAIGAGKPFGIVLALDHTDRLEHEVGNFSKYAINQLSGRNTNGNSPTIDYRDRFERHLRLSLLKGFDVLGIVWAPDDVRSYPGDRPGWRKTPLAYVVAKAKDASVDTIAPVQIDMDFNDNLSKVVLPIVSPGVMVNAAAVAPRPTGRIAIDQTINDRDIAAGRAVLTVKAAGAGLMPNLDRVIDLGTVGGFTVAGVQDDGVKTDRFETVPVSDGNYAANPEPTVFSQRIWTITLQAKPSVNARSTFHFPAVARPAGAPEPAAVSYFRLSDADVQPIDAAAASQGFTYDTARAVWPWVLGLTAGVIALCAGVVIVLRVRKPSKAEPDQQAPRPPATLFSTLVTLRQLEADPARSAQPKEGTTLTDDIRQLEQLHFHRPATNGHMRPDIDYDRLVRKWTD